MKKLGVVGKSHTQLQWGRGTPFYLRQTPVACASRVRFVFTRCDYCSFVLTSTQPSSLATFQHHATVARELYIIKQHDAG